LRAVSGGGGPNVPSASIGRDCESIEVVACRSRRFRCAVDDFEHDKRLVAPLRARRHSAPKARRGWQGPFRRQSRARAARRDRFDGGASSSLGHLTPTVFPRQAKQA
jgi:hypothetical protein